jgi:rare lipoprotein A (peptidoglycan hydrolase)
MGGFPNFTCQLQQTTMVSSPSNQALDHGCQKQQTRMSNPNVSMRFKLASFFLAAGLLSGAPAQAKQCGQASWYGPGLYGNLTASGERLRPNTMTAAHPTLPFGSWVRVVNRDNGLVADVRISDRGPYIGGRIIDLAHGAAQRLGVSGLANVCISRL